ncbi:MAG: benzoylformate decarboxylase [Rhodococcus sp. (in: high G+C Gram-positive bacteria)]|uniref:benzoylformate decarboxylase n=1 Tax=Rhodococcus sp. TaxID=1831 RepID=UPI003BB7EABB
MTTVSEATYEVLRARGLTTVFGNPGSNELPFLSGMPDDFRYILGLHEGAVLSMADGYSLVSGDAVFVNLHAASGSGNAMGALTNSVYSHSPLVVTAGQQVRSTIGQEVMLSNVDAGTLLKPLVKWSSEPTCAEDVPRTINQAIHTALLPAKGPVYVSVPYDDWAHQAPADSADLVHRQVHSAAAISGDQLDSLAEILATATNPALVLGPAVDADHANNHAVQLADTLRAPVWIAPSPSRCPFPTRHPSFRGVLPAGIADLASTLNGHDVVLVIGAPVFRYHQYVPGNYLPDGTRLIQITDDPGEAARAPVGEAYVAPVGATLDALSSLIEPSTRPPLPPRDRVDAPISTGHGLDPAHLFSLIRTAAPDDAIYVNESTSTADAFWSQMDLPHQGSYYFPASGGLGFGLPAAVGAQLAAPQRRVVGLIGDGSANYGITALWTAAQYRIPVVFIILKNGTYGALRGFSQILGTGETPGLDVPGIDFVEIATGYGVAATAVATAEDFTTAFKDALTATEPHLIEVQTTFSHN